MAKSGHINEDIVKQWNRDIDYSYHRIFGYKQWKHVLCLIAWLEIVI